MDDKPRDSFGRFISPREVGNFEITVWDVFEGDIKEKIWNGAQGDLDDIEEKYRGVPGIEVDVKERGA